MNVEIINLFNKTHFDQQFMTAFSNLYNVFLHCISFKEVECPESVYTEWSWEICSSIPPIFILLFLRLWANSSSTCFYRLLLFILLFLFPIIQLQSQFELQCMAITKEIKYCPHLQTFWPHSSWFFYFQYLKSCTPSVPLKYLLHYWMHYSLEEEERKKYHFSIYESFLSLLFTFSSLCVSSSYDILNYFWPNTMSQSWNILFCHYFFQHFYSSYL